MKQYYIFAFVILFQTISSGAAFLTEEQALFSALKNNHEIKILHLEARSDSLNPKSAATGWLPDVHLQSGLSVIPIDSSSTTNGQISTSKSSSAIRTPNTLSVSQHLPGGGTVDGRFSFDQSTYYNKADSSYKATDLEVSVTQPLLRDAWRSDPVTQRITLAQLDNKKFSLKQQQQLLSYCSDIRTTFWKLFEVQALVSLYRQEVAYAEELLSIERTRAKLGNSPPLDTLRAKLAYINSTARLHDAQSDLIQLQEELSFKCGFDDKQSIVDSTTRIITPALPPPDTMISLVKRLDPQLHIFDIAAQKLELMQKQTRNSLLPNIALKASLQQNTNTFSPSDNKQYHFNSVIGLIVTYNLPVKPRNLQLEENAIALEINTLQQERYAKELHLRLSDLSRSWERERRAIEIATFAESLARQTLKATREGYTVGTVDRLSLDKAENDYRSARIEQLRKQLLMKQLEIVFDEITGLTLSKFGVQL